MLRSRLRARLTLVLCALSAACDAVDGAADAASSTTPAVDDGIGGGDASSADLGAGGADAGGGAVSDAAPTDAGPCQCPPDDTCATHTCGEDGGCVTTALEGPCDDGDPCTADDVCTEGACQGTPLTCDDANGCTEDLCLPGPVCPDGTPPVDGTCVTAIPSVQPLDWTAAREACRLAGGDFAPVLSAETNDRARHAADTLCGEGAPALLGLSDSVEEGLFVWPTGEAADFTRWDGEGPANDLEEKDFVALLPDGAWVTTEESLTCVVCSAAPGPFTCTHEPRAPSDDPEACNGEDDDCDGDADEEPEGAVLCDDRNLCTADACGGPDGCLYQDISASCDDAVGCTVDTCDAAAGCVRTPDDTACDDGIACTVDRCDPVAGCVHEAQDAGCDDGQPCTTDVCTLGVGCEYTTDDAQCDDAIDCTADRCVPVEGCVHEGQDALCEDGELCTDNVCVPEFGCEFPLNEAPCDDGEICTAVDRCVEGVCTGVEPTLCDDEQPCTADACAPGVGCVAPLDGECDSPGPAGGYFEGAFTVRGDVDVRFLPDVHWECHGALTAVVDASRPNDLDGFGEAFCSYSVFLYDYAFPQHVDIRGRLQDLQFTGEVQVADLITPWNPLLLVAPDGVPRAIEGTTNGTVPTRQLASIAQSGSSTLSSVVLFASPVMTPYTFQASLTRVPVRGQCCGPNGGCEDSEDYECFRKGWRFSPGEAGQCCVGADCAIRSQAECRAIAGEFVPSYSGACCLEDAPERCVEMSGALCDSLGGTRQSKLLCLDENADGLPDPCGAPANFGYTAPPGCTLEGDLLTARVNDLFDLKLRGAWAANGDGYDTSGNVGLETPLGTVTLPGTTNVHVGCGDRFSLIGEAGVPGLGGIQAWPSIGVQPLAPRLSLGFGYGYELRARGAEGPISDGRPYLFATANTAAGLNVGQNITITAPQANSVTVAIDPTDPAFVFELNGALLHNASGGLVRGVGLSMSVGGNLTWRSAIDLYDGEGFVPQVATGHLYRAGEFALLPIPGLPANLYLDGDLLIDVGDAVNYLEPIAQGLVAGDLDALGDALARAADLRSVEDVLSDLEYSGNVNALRFIAGPLTVNIGRGAFQYKDGRVTYTGEGFTPGEALANGEAGELFRAFSALTIRESGRSWGYVDPDGFQFNFEADLAAGPFELEGVVVTLDSGFGIRISGGSFDFDFSNFMLLLESLMDCQFDDGTATCSVLNIPVIGLHGELTDGGFDLSAHMGVPVVGEVDFSARVQSDGNFDLRGTAAQGIPGFISSSATVILRDESFSIGLDWNQFAQSFQLLGTLGFDGSFYLRGTGLLEVIGFPIVQVDATMDSETGITAEGRLFTLPFLANGSSARVRLTVPRGLDDWHLEGSADMEVFGYRLASGRVSADAGTSGLGLLVEGEVGIGSARAALSGRISPDRFALSGIVDLVISNYRLSRATVTLGSDGLRVDGMLRILGVEIRVLGRVEPNGDFLFSSAGRVNLPLPGLGLSIDARLQKTGGHVAVSGNGSFDFGIHWDGSYYFDTGGRFSMTVGINKGFDLGFIYGNGVARVSVGNGGASGYFSGEGCVYVPVFSDPCAGIGGSFNSSGRICVSFLGESGCFGL